MLSRIKISRNIESEINTVTQESIKQHVNKNLENKLDSYFKSVWTHKPDAEVKIEFRLEKISNGKFEVKMHIVIDGKSYSFKKSTEGEDDIYMLIDSLFKTTKAELSDDHGR